MTLVVTREWPQVVGNPKAPVVERRLRKTRAKLDAWGREIEMLDAIFREHAGGGARVLDVACGTGFSILELAARGYRTSGVDVDPALCQLVAAAARSFDIPASASAGDACRLPYADSSFDVVMSRSFFEHVYDRDLALGEQLRVLRPGGLLFLNDGNLQNPRLLFDLLVSYPLRTRGRHGGLVWLLTKRRVWKDLYGYLPLGRDEDVKTPRWWRRFIGRRDDCRLIEAATSAKYMYPDTPKLLHPFLGSCQVLALKR